MPAKKNAFLLGITACFFVFASPVLALTDQADLAVGMKTLPLLTTKLSGAVSVAIVYDPANAGSKDEAMEIKGILDSGFTALGDIKLSGIMVPVGELTKVSGSKIAILTSGLQYWYKTIGSAAATGGILTMSTDLGCVQANQCVLGIVSKPHVEIYYSKMAADNAKISFGQVFSMLVKQI